MHDSTSTAQQRLLSTVRGSSTKTTVALCVLGVLSLGFYLALALLHTHEMLGMFDLGIYRAGASVAWHHGRLYDDRFTYGFPFTYPPIAALVLIPVAAMPSWLAKTVVLACSLASLAAVSWLILDGTEDRRRRALLALAATAIGLWLEPVQQTLSFGQINLVLMLIIVADLMRPDYRRWKGVGVGVAAALKLTPAIFVLYLLLTGRRRPALRACVTFIGCFFVGWIALPGQSSRYWLDGLFYNSDRVGNAGYVANQSIHGVLVRLFGDSTTVQLVWLMLVLSVGCLGLLLAAAAFRRSGEAVGVLITALTGLLVSPISWSHHWVWVAPAFALTLAIAVRQRSRVAFGLATIGGLVFFAWPMSRQVGEAVIPRGIIWAVPLRLDNHEHQWHQWQLLIGNAEVVFGAVTFVALCLAVRRFGISWMLRPNATATRLRTRTEVRDRDADVRETGASALSSG
jgi:alpha-1,2-mannosyltransferase